MCSCADKLIYPSADEIFAFVSIFPQKVLINCKPARNVTRWLCHLTIRAANNFLPAAVRKLNVKYFETLDKLRSLNCRK